ncbi:7647_t:CDS:2 [Funneliformis caledonium]|uniref:7647_t:CDS:1 n=1 Tax=Funneliformis caledonium TaxID=1117310 RepID=A0A9N8V7I2_9GLOM|nr:7647_t:CDS:2 [Funneliformis caledonium]
MSTLFLKSRQLFAGSFLMQTRQFSFKFSRVLSPLGSHMSIDPEIVKQEKEKVVKREKTSTIKSAPGWSENLASESEAAVKAERDHSVTIEDLQNHSINIIEQHHGDRQEQPRQEQ